MPPSPPVGVTDRVPPWLMVLIGIVSLQVGAALAKDLFALAPPSVLVLMRLATAALLLMAIARPRLRGRSRRDWLVVVAFGLCLAGMNLAIYSSFARIPLGMAITLEFLGPLGLALVTSRRLRDVAWVLLAALGVALLGFDPRGLNPAGVVLALLAGGLWVGYILLSREVGRAWTGVSGLALASTVGMLVLLGPVVAVHGTVLTDPRVLLLGLAVGVLSSAIPYSVELVALRRMTPRAFSVLMSLEPAAAALAAWLLLGELLTPAQGVALLCVVLASVGATRSAGGPPRS